MKRFSICLLIFTLCFPLCACPFRADSFDGLILASHRIMTLTRATTEVGKELDSQKILNVDQSLVLARGLLKAQTVHAESYRLLKAARQGNQLILSGAVRAELEANTQALKAFLPDRNSFPSPAAIKLGFVLDPLQLAIEDFVKRVSKIKMPKGQTAEPLTLYLTARQWAELDAGLALSQQIESEVQAWIN